MSAITIRSMAPADWPTALQLSTAVGWNQTAADWERLWQLDPAGAFVAEHAGTVVGTTLCCRFETVAWLAMVIVDPRFRDRGIGRRLVETGLDFAESQGVSTVRLDATPLGERVYGRFAFLPQFSLMRLRGIAICPSNGVSSAVGVRPAVSADDFAAIRQWDQRATHTSRASLLESLHAAKPIWIAETPTGVPLGFLARRVGRSAWHIGPCCGTHEAASALLKSALTAAQGQAVIVDLPAHCVELMDLASSCGLSAERPLLRMCRGTPLIEDHEFFHISSGPELG